MLNNWTRKGAYRTRIVPGPSEALAASAGGVVMLRLVIDEDGRVGEVCVLGVDPQGYGFEEAAVQAVRQWRFEPALVEGAAVPAYSVHYMSWDIGSR